MECFKCGISDKKVQLCDAITKDGVIKICEKCAGMADFPIIRKPTTFQLKEIERKPTIYERLSKMAGIKFDKEKAEKKEYLIKQETSLREIVDKNYQEREKPEKTARADLVDNFHWIIMRARRSKKLTQKQLAEAVRETEIAIKKAEEGALPDDKGKLLKKIQDYLGINLYKENLVFSENKPVFPAKKLMDFDVKGQDNLSVGDLKKMHEIKKTSDEDESEKKEDTGKELSDEDIHNLIFKK
jgi:ribosome-binding protein aMBF1 (putative translation factor)